MLHLCSHCEWTPRLGLSAGHLRLEISLAAHLAVHGCERVKSIVGSRTTVEQTQHLRAEGREMKGRVNGVS